MHCPSCNASLLMTDRNGIEIDYCPDCRGVWLDRGELDKIIERSIANTSNSHSSSHSNTSHSHSSPSNYYTEKLKYEAMKKHHHKKHRGFLGDLFDF